MLTEFLIGNIGNLINYYYNYLMDFGDFKPHVQIPFQQWGTDPEVVCAHRPDETFLRFFEQVLLLREMAHVVPNVVARNLSMFEEW